MSASTACATSPYLCNVAKQDGNLLDGTTRVSREGEPVFVMSFLGNMAEYAVAPSISVVPMTKDVPFQAAALIGCGVTTGVGAAVKTAAVRPGSTVAVWGCGGVGLSVVQGARIAGASRIVAVDLSAEKMEMARRFGATDSVTPGGDAVREVFEMTGRIGVDYAFEAIGNPRTIEQCIKVVRRGGTAVLVGVGGREGALLGELAGVAADRQVGAGLHVRQRQHQGGFPPSTSISTAGGPARPRRE